MSARMWPSRPRPAGTDVLAAVLASAVDAVGPDRADSLSIDVDPGSGVPVLLGDVGDWDVAVAAGHAAAARWSGLRGANPGDVVVELDGGARPAGGTSAVGIGTPPDRVDVVVIGAGICGLAVAHALARSGAVVAVVDGADRIASATTAWNNGMVHPGHDPAPGTRKARLNIEGNALWGRFAHDLDVPFERRTSLVVGFDDGDDVRLGALLDRARRNGVPGVALIDGDEARRIEPRLAPTVTGALFTPTTASIDAVRVSEALAAGVRRHGGSVVLGTPVTRITVEDGAVSGVETARGRIDSRLVVNAAGVQADALAATAGSRRYSVHPRRGTLVLFDTGGEPFRTSVGPIPGPYSKGGGMTARPDGRTTGGPTAVEQQDRASGPPTAAEVQHILDLGSRIYPAFPVDAVVRVGAEVRPALYGEDFVVGPVPGVPGLVDVAGTQSPGVAAAPAIAVAVVDALRGLGAVPVT